MEEQDVRIFSRGSMELTGISEVESFSEEQITLSSSMGMISVEGREMKIESFSTEKGEIRIRGTFDSLVYYGSSAAEKRGFWSRFFR